MSMIELNNQDGILVKFKNNTYKLNIKPYDYVINMISKLYFGPNSIQIIPITHLKKINLLGTRLAIKYFCYEKRHNFV